MKKYFLVLSVLSVAILGGLFTHSFKEDTTETSAPFEIMHTLVVTPDINIYSETAVAIVVGTIKDVINTHANIDVKEVLKGDREMKTLSIQVMDPSLDDAAILTSGENVLLFVCQNSYGVYVICAGDEGKVLIDENNNAIGAAVFTMPLNKLKAKIQAALDNQNSL